MYEALLGSVYNGPVAPAVVPGAETLTSGNLSAGYYSTVAANDFITPGAFCTKVGLTQGNLINSTSDWVKMSYRSKVIFYSKQCIRNTISWSDLAALGIHDGSKIVRILGHDYRCRIMKASTVDPYTDGNISNPTQMQGTEYSDTILRMCSTVTSVDGGSKLGSFTEAELGLMTGLDVITNTSSGGTGAKMAIGGSGSITKVTSPNNGTVGFGYRAVLELIEPFPTVADSGPGPSALINYEPEDKAGYFGQVSFDDFFTIEQIEAIALVPLPGSPNNRDATNGWLKMYLNGKVIYLLRKTVRTTITWNDIYNAGFQYGEDGNGRAPSSTPTNQLRVLSKTMPDGTILKYKVRAIQAYGVDPYPASLIKSQTALSEFALLRERLTPTTGVPITWDTLGTISNQTQGVEKNAAGTSSLMLNNSAVYLNRTSFSTTDNRFCNFYPVLELIEVIKP